jgi:hypothetical protein
MAAALEVPPDRGPAAAAAVSEAYLSDRWVPAPGAAPSGCTHVGDSVPLDVRPALDLGMRAVHVDPHGACAATDHDHAVSLAAFVQHDGGDGREGGDR